MLLLHVLQGAEETTLSTVGIGLTAGLAYYVLMVRHIVRWMVDNIYDPPDPPFLLRYDVMVVIGTAVFFLLDELIPERVFDDYVGAPIVVAFLVITAASAWWLIRYEARHGPVYWRTDT
jgi:hypothetical protein